jgi:hypothetical protein
MAPSMSFMEGDLANRADLHVGRRSCLTNRFVTGRVTPCEHDAAVSQDMSEASWDQVEARCCCTLFQTEKLGLNNFSAHPPTPLAG